MFNKDKKQDIAYIFRVYIFSSKDNVSHELRTGGNGYFDLKDINELWGKDLKYRASGFERPK